MKNIFVAAIFLFSQLGMTAEKAKPAAATQAKKIATKDKKSKNAKTKKFTMEDLTFSGLLLTKQEFIHLSENDKKAYILSMIALGQVIEGSQRFHMGYDYKMPKTSQRDEAVDSTSSKYASLFYLVVPQAEAWGPLISGAIRMLGVAGSWVMTKVPAFAAKKGAPLTEQMSLALAPTKEALKTMTKAVSEKAKAVVAAKDQYMKALKKNSDPTKELKEKADLEKAQAALMAEKDEFIKGGGTLEQFTKASNESGLKKVLMWPFRNKASLVTGGLAAYGADTLLLEKTGLSVEKLFDKVGLAVENWVSGTDLSGPGAMTLEQLKAGDSAKDKGKNCLFGGIPSLWTEFATGEIKCTRPAESMSESCRQEDGKFLCSNHGIKLAEGSTDKSLCLDLIAVDNLTVRCTKALTAILEVQVRFADSDVAAESIQKNLGEVLASLEARDRMKNAEGKTKSIYEYCMADSVTQTEECGAIKEIIAYLKTTDVMKLYETRVVLGQITPATETPEEAAPATPGTPADDAGAAGVETTN